MRSSTVHVLAVLAGGLAIGALLLAERKRPLRMRADPGARRLMRNAAMAGLAGATVALTERPVVEPLAREVEKRRVGLVQVLPVRPLWRDVLAIVLMDYTLYGWHVWMHKSDALYRLHQVHHSDLDLDASTALRFHFGEMLASVPWRAAQVAVLGTSPRALRWWQRLTTASILFHHSNLRLPVRWERRISRFVMTPRLHGIHHSVVRDQQDSNWSSGLTLWDFLHGTYRDDVPQQRINIGVPSYRSRGQVTFWKLLWMPKARGRESVAFNPVERPRTTHSRLR